MQLTSNFFEQAPLSLLAMINRATSSGSGLKLVLTYTSKLSLLSCPKTKMTYCTFENQQGPSGTLTQKASTCSEQAVHSKQKLAASAA
jgi:hypothetical protein